MNDLFKGIRATRSNSGAIMTKIIASNTPPNPKGKPPKDQRK